jgi:hypothetical protein
MRIDIRPPKAKNRIQNKSPRTDRKSFQSPIGERSWETTRQKKNTTRFPIYVGRKLPNVAARGIQIRGHSPRSSPV